MKFFLKRLASTAVAVCVLVGGTVLPNIPKVNSEGAEKYLTAVTDNSTVASTVSVDDSFYNEILAKYDSDYNAENTALLLSTPRQFMAFLKAGATNGGKKDFSGKYVKLANDIDFNGTLPTVTKTPSGENFSIEISGSLSNVCDKTISTFAGTFDGNYKRIRNMVTSSKVNQGFAPFSSNKGTIKNLGIAGNSCIIVSYGGASTGGFIDGNYGTVENVYSEANVYIPTNSVGAYNAGSLVSFNTDTGKINNCYTTGNIYVETGGSAAGLAASNHGAVTNSFATGDVYLATSGEVGGIVTDGHTSGESTRTVTNCYRNSDAIVTSTKNGTVNTSGTPLTAAQMTGEAAKTNMVGFANMKDSNGNPIWKFVANGFPQLAGFSIPAEGTKFDVDGLTYIVNSNTSTVSLNSANGGSEPEVIIPSTVTDGDGNNYAVTRIENRAFYSSSFTSIVMPDSITTLEVQGIYACNNLESVVMSKNITEILGNTFGYCPKLKRLDIPNSVTAVNSSAFESSPLVTLYCSAATYNRLGGGQIGAVPADRIVITDPIKIADQSATIKGKQTSTDAKYIIEIEWGGEGNNGLNFVYDKGVYNTETGKLEAQNSNVEAGGAEGSPGKWYGFDGVNNKVKVTNLSNGQVKTTATVSKITQANTTENIEFKLYFDSAKSWSSEGATAQQLTGVSHTAAGKPDQGKTMMTYGEGKNISYTMPQREFDASGNDTGKDTSVGFFVNISGEPGSGLSGLSKGIGTITLNFKAI